MYNYLYLIFFIVLVFLLILVTKNRITGGYWEKFNQSTNTLETIPRDHRMFTGENAVPYVYPPCEDGDILIYIYNIENNPISVGVFSDSTVGDLYRKARSVGLKNCQMLKYQGMKLHDMDEPLSDLGIGAEAVITAVSALVNILPPDSFTIVLDKGEGINCWYFQYTIFQLIANAEQFVLAYFLIKTNCIYNIDRSRIFHGIPEFPFDNVSPIVERITINSLWVPPVGEDYGVVIHVRRYVHLYNMNIIFPTLKLTQARYLPQGG